MDLQVTDPDIIDVVRNTRLRRDDLEHVFIELSMSQVDVENAKIRANTTDPQLQSINVLREWRRNNGKKATRAAIIAALAKCKYENAKEILLGKWTTPTSSIVQLQPRQFSDVIEELAHDQLTKLFLQLGLTDREIQNARLNSGSNDVELQAREAFRFWVEINGHEATQEAVLEALIQCKFNNAHYKVRKKWKLKNAASEVRGASTSSRQASSIQPRQRSTESRNQQANPRISAPIDDTTGTSEAESHEDTNVATAASTSVTQTSSSSTLAKSASSDQGEDTTDSQEGGTLTLKDLQWGKTKLGRGAQGEVYPVTFTGRYQTGFKGRTTAAVKRVVEGDYATNEIGKLQKVAHANIVKLLGVIGPIEDSNPPFKRMYYIVMERGDMNLFDYMDDRNKPLTTELKFKWALSITDAVRHLHNNRIVHRDLKPQNCIIFTETLKLCDFGISRDASSTMTTTGGRGTYFYIAPETDRENPINTGEKTTFSNKSDVYQVGCVLWELFARKSLLKPPYQELSFLDAHVQIESILRKCLDTNPDNRPNISTLHSQLTSISNENSVQ